MRLWHKDLVPVLPRQQLLGQWRELCAIMRNIEAKGTPGHILVNRVMDYPPSHLYTYFSKIVKEMENRGYKASPGKFSQHFYASKWVILEDDGNWIVENPFPGWMNDRYLTQCYYNLQEKHDCGGITDEEWDRIDDRYRKALLEHAIKKLDKLAGKGRQ